ncbi:MULTISPECIES: transposase [Sphingomonadaceae]|uniref:IS66 family transposase n=1 Tax=Sphingomonadales TaxID=204457 RepID=UPI0035C8C770
MYAKLYEPGADGSPRFREAACFAHWRRDFHDIWTSQKSEIAHEALERIGQLYDIEREIAGKSAYSPTSSCWPNQVERFFALLTEKRIKTRGR